MGMLKRRESYITSWVGGRPGKYNWKYRCSRGKKKGIVENGWESGKEMSFLFILFYFILFLFFYLPQVICKKEPLHLGTCFLLLVFKSHTQEQLKSLMSALKNLHTLTTINIFFFSAALHFGGNWDSRYDFMPCSRSVNISSTTEMCTLPAIDGSCRGAREELSSKK